MRTTIRIAALLVLGLLPACAEERPTPAQGQQETKTSDTAPPEVTLQSGLRYVDLVIGNGREVAAGNTVDVQYSGWVHQNGTRGKLFDTSIGGRPFTVTIGLTDVIKGWTEGLTGMRIGGKRKLIVPPHLGFGPGVVTRGTPVDAALVDQNSTLEYEVELLEISGHFDLGGPCALRGQRGQPRPLSLTGKQQEELRRIRNWDALIEGARQNVRSDCSVPYRWETLFFALLDGHRYRDAIQVLTDMAMRRFPLPHAVLAKGDPAFLTSDEFKASESGMEYARTEDANEQNIRLAESRLSSMPAQERPPNPYRAVGACPFECCVYREWTTKSAVQLLESIDSTTIVAEIPANTRVQAVTGEVWVEPQPYVALKDNGFLKAGDVIFFLDYLGEGFVNYWHNGRVNPRAAQRDGLFADTYENCNANNPNPAACSLKKLYPERKFSNEWWVKIRTTGGKEGWVLNTGQFANTDACG
jgi:FKBP-type peptidyl-prolyl cis-trans isomerase FkpA